MWPIKIALSKLRPFNAAAITRTAIVTSLFAAFLYGDFALFRRLFAAMAKIEEATPFFPIQRVSQIVATIAIIVLTVAVLAFRMSRPERLFASINTDDVTRVLRSVELPSLDRYPGTALADSMVAMANGRPASVLPPKIAVTAFALFAAFVLIARRIYFPAFVRARESMAPAALGATNLTNITDRMLQPFSPPTSRVSVRTSLPIM